MKTYTGIGSRETPAATLSLMESVAERLAYLGWTLRSGGAQGADQAFEVGAFAAYFGRPGSPKPELYLPWVNFEGHRRTVAALSEPQPEAFEIARRFHPAWDRLSQGARRLHARNVHQILGRDVTAPVLTRFVICWTKDAKRGGGTGQALRVAEHYDVPIFDLALASDEERVLAFVRR